MMGRVSSSASKASCARTLVVSSREGRAESGRHQFSRTLRACMLMFLAPPRVQTSKCHVRRTPNDDLERSKGVVKMRLLWALLPLVPTVLAQGENVTDSLLWGTFRPNLYFGLRPQLPQSLMTGLVWFGTQDYQSFSSAS